jgi:hypothetical protein
MQRKWPETEEDDKYEGQNLRLTIKANAWNTVYTHKTHLHTPPPSITNACLKGPSISSPEAEFLDEIKIKVLRVFFLAIHSHLYSLECMEYCIYA